MKIYSLFLIISLFFVLGCLGENNKHVEEANLVLENDPDDYECNSSAGYLWCEGKQKCLRGWEEMCDVINKTCTTNDECKTPLSYAVRSICPFSSHCYEGQCIVACLDWVHDPNLSVGKSYPVLCEENSDCTCDDRMEKETKKCACIDKMCGVIVAV